MYGIAPIESAAYGRPAIVSDAGGLPTVVLDGQTGRVVPLQTPVPGWADAVEAAVSRPERYQSLSEQARRRYLEVLNWDVWGCSVRALAAQEIESPKARKVAGRS
jgi:glycosyltransferase involved in cell wall biosynthesis